MKIRKSYGLFEEKFYTRKLDLVLGNVMFFLFFLSIAIDLTVFFAITDFSSPGLKWDWVLFSIYIVPVITTLLLGIFFHRKDIFEEK